MIEEMGIDRTTRALNHIQRNNEARPVVIVCETILKQNWVSEAEKFFGDTETIQNIEIFEPVEIYGSVIIIDYVLFKKHRKELLQANVKIIIFDESQRLRDIKDKRITGVQIIRA